MNVLLSRLGGALARFLSREHHVHGTAPITPPSLLAATLRPGDVLLVEGNSRISTAIKYLTQSTWSHAALYVGPLLAEYGGPQGHVLVEADTVDGVRSVSLEPLAMLPSRICRPIGLTDVECRRVCHYAIERIGNRYDLRNVIDLARYLLQTPPVPLGMRRGMLALGSGDPTRAICSTLIAQAFQSVRYPILPVIEQRRSESPDCPACIEEIARIRHHSLFVPRDFDVSPYFQIVKPMLEQGFDFHGLHWTNQTTDQLPAAISSFER
jgi:hypothetical protein